MILSDADIERYLRNGMLRIDGLHEDAIQPASVDVTLGAGFLVPQGHTEICPYVVPVELDDIRMVPSPHDDFLVLPPQGFALGTTEEVVRLPSHIGAQVDGRSSTGRRGITVHITAGWIDPGFEGHITLELVNHNPFAVVLRAGQPICQLKFMMTFTPSRRPYGHESRRSRYQHQRGVTAARPKADLAP